MRRVRRIDNLVTHSDLVGMFSKNYIPLNVDTEYIRLLKGPKFGDLAVRIIHVDHKNDYMVKMMWKALRERFSNEDTRKYKQLTAFGRDKTGLQFRGQVGLLK